MVCKYAQQSQFDVLNKPRRQCVNCTSERISRYYMGLVLFLFRCAIVRPLFGADKLIVSFGLEKQYIYSLIVRVPVPCD